VESSHLKSPRITNLMDESMFDVGQEGGRAVTDEEIRISDRK
jgi:hypothetical protein